jgi:gluconolactonase
MSGGLRVLAKGPAPLSSPALDREGRLFVVCPETGDLFVVADGGLEQVANSGGSPTGIAFDTEGVPFVSDQAHQAVLTLSGDKQLSEFVKEYEGRPLQGPSGICFDSDGTLYFTDCGVLGETSLSNSKGSIFSVSADGRLLQPILLDTLAHPSSICLSKTQPGILFVTELLKNRIIRLVQHPVGVHVASVFAHLSGRLGPSAITVDSEGFVYVTHSELPPVIEAGVADGLVTVVGSDGKIAKELRIPGYPDLNGITYDAKKNALILTESTQCVVLEVPL